MLELQELAERSVVWIKALESLPARATLTKNPIIQGVITST